MRSLVVEVDGSIADANAAAESFFDMSRAMLKRHRLADIVPFASPLLSLLEQAAHRGAPLNEYRVDLGNPKLGPDRVVDIHVSPMGDLRDRMMILLQERSIADKFDRQLTHRGAARSVSALAAMLAHEIKNPLSGIRGAAQLLETAVGDDDRALTQLICEETDRIVKLVDRMEAFSDLRPIERESVNIHAVLDRVKRVALAGFARHIRFVETYDPSLPPVFGNRDQLVQVFLNLVKNAAEALGPDVIDGTIELTTAFRPGVRLRTPGPRRPSACRSNSASATTVRVFRPTSRPTFSTLSSRRNRRELALDLLWWPKSSAIMAAPSNANPIRGERRSGFSCPCSRRVTGGSARRPERPGTQIEGMNGDEW